MTFPKWLQQAGYSEVAWNLIEHRFNNSSMNAGHIALLTRTSRTFLLPILRAPTPLREAIGTAYLCMRAIDEIEDHPGLSAEAKAGLLKGIAAVLRNSEQAIDRDAMASLFRVHAAELDDVTLKLAEIAEAAPVGTRPLIWNATADMADEMATWVESNWKILDEAALDAYTFTVAGRVGLMLSELWTWYDGTRCDREESLAFGRALQAVNIVRNQREDRERGVDFYPTGWTRKDMIAYARRQIALADRYMEKLDRGPIYEFCTIPLTLAKATLSAIAGGREKLSREEVEYLVASLEYQ